MTTTEDHELAALVARDAGRSLLHLRATWTGDRKQLRAQGDRIAHEQIVAALGAHRPDDAVLSEEAVDDPRRLAASRVWIVDPLDGTREFSEDGRVDWAVHVALVADGELVGGAVAIPGLDVTYSAGALPPLAPAPGGAPRMVVSRTRPPAVATAVAEHLGAQMVPLGSAGAKAMAVVRGDAELYVHAGGQYEWDSAAPVAVATAAGLHASRLDGSPLRYNQPDPWLPDLVICRPELAKAVLEVIAATGAERA